MPSSCYWHFTAVLTHLCVRCLRRQKRKRSGRELISPAVDFGIPRAGQIVHNFIALVPMLAHIVAVLRRIGNPEIEPRALPHFPHLTQIISYPPSKDNKYKKFNRFVILKARAVYYTQSKKEAALYEQGLCCRKH